MNIFPGYIIFNAEVSITRYILIFLLVLYCIYLHVGVLLKLNILDSSLHRFSDFNRCLVNNITFPLAPSFFIISQIFFIFLAPKHPTSISDIRTEGPGNYKAVLVLSSPI